MKEVAKYNICKGVSTALTVGTPIVTLACCGDFFVHRSDTAISAAGIFAMLLACLLFKDKLAEQWKTPSAFVLSLAVFILIVFTERILTPMKYVCIATMIASGIDEVTFKRIYKQIEKLLPQEAQAFKTVGFIFTTTEKLKELDNEPS